MLPQLPLHMLPPLPYQPYLLESLTVVSSEDMVVFLVDMVDLLVDMDSLVMVVIFIKFKNYSTSSHYHF